MSEVYYNSHVHTLTIRHIPRHFIWGMDTKWFLDDSFKHTIGMLLHSLNPFSSKDMLDRYRLFIDQSTEKTQSEILLDLFKEYRVVPYKPATNFLFNVLSIDFEYAGMGECLIPFKHQIREVSDMAKEFPECVMPFIGLDPRRPRLMDMVMEAINQQGFQGGKLYPNLGFFPNDSRLRAVYDFMQFKKKPLICHCSRTGVHGRNPITEDSAKQYSCLDNSWWCFKTDNKKNQIATDPRNYEVILQDFPDLNVCFGHSGGIDDVTDFVDKGWHKEITVSRPYGNKLSDNWTNIILHYAKNYPNAYFDTAYLLMYPEGVAFVEQCILHPKLRSKILIGSDWYMDIMDMTETDYMKKVKGLVSIYAPILDNNYLRFMGQH